MYTLTVIIIILVVLSALGFLYSIFKNRITFFVTGLDAGFSISDLVLLWTAAELCNLKEPTALFYSMPALTKCMAQISNQTNSDGTQKHQLLMSKLFDYRTKIQNEADDKKGLATTQSLDKGQKLRIILPGKGVFSSEIMNNGNQIVISVPKQNNLIPIPGEEWVGKVISVYLWRKGDARYVFDTTVTQQGLFLGKSSLFIKHSANLVRTQKRKSIRVKCELHGMLYIVKKDTVDVSAIETQNGYRCSIEDISESGALIRIGGKGVQNVRIKLQFNINNKLILMVGVIRTVEYNEAKNQSLLHFECTHIETSMRNEILKYVYNLLPETEKEVLQALEETEADSKLMESDENASGQAPASSETTATAQTTQTTPTPQAKQTSAASPAASESSETKAEPEADSSHSEPEAEIKSIGPTAPEDEINVF